VSTDWTVEAADWFGAPDDERETDPNVGGRSTPAASPETTPPVTGSAGATVSDIVADNLADGDDRFDTAADLAAAGEHALALAELDRARTAYRQARDVAVGDDAKTVDRRLEQVADLRAQVEDE
jgi:hypothetical protein